MLNVSVCGLFAAAAAFALAAGILLCGGRGAAEPPEEEQDPLGPEILHIPLLERRAEQVPRFVSVQMRLSHLDAGQDK